MLLSLCQPIRWSRFKLNCLVDNLFGYLFYQCLRIPMRACLTSFSEFLSQGFRKCVCVYPYILPIYSVYLFDGGGWVFGVKCYSVMPAIPTTPPAVHLVCWVWLPCVLSISYTVSAEIFRFLLKPTLFCQEFASPYSPPPGDGISQLCRNASFVPLLHSLWCWRGGG